MSPNSRLFCRTLQIFIFSKILHSSTVIKSTKFNCQSLENNFEKFINLPHAKLKCLLNWNSSFYVVKKMRNSSESCEKVLNLWYSCKKEKKTAIFANCLPEKMERYLYNLGNLLCIIRSDNTISSKVQTTTSMTSNNYDFQLTLLESSTFEKNCNFFQPKMFI